MKCFELLVTVLIFVLMTGGQLSTHYCNLNLSDQTTTVLFAIGTPFNLSCPSTYELKPCFDVSNTMLWLLNGVELVGSYRMRIDNNSNTLSVTYGMENDVGEYVCRISKNVTMFQRTFYLVVTDATPMQTDLLPNVLPMNEGDEKRGHIYWLPHMLHPDQEQHLITNVGSQVKLTASFYIALENIDKNNFSVTWDHLLKIHADVHVESENWMNHKTSKLVCSDLDKRFMMRSLRGSCFEDIVYISSRDFFYEGDYMMVVKVSHSGKTNLLNLTYPVYKKMKRINRNELRKSVQMDFNKNDKVCRHSSYQFLCTFKPYSNYITIISRGLFVNDPWKELMRSENNNSNLQNDDLFGSVSSFTPLNLKYRIANATRFDAGSYFCISRPPRNLTPIEYMGITIWYRMELAVMDLADANCISKKKEYCIIASLVFMVLIMMASMVMLRLYHVNSYLVKTVFVKPNKGCVSNDCSSQNLLPDVFLRTVRKFKIKITDGISYKKQMTKYTSVPSHEMSSRMMKNYCAFHSSNAYEAAPSQDFEMVPSTSQRITETSPDDRKIYKQFHVVMKNQCQTKYFLPSYIGWTFDKEDVAIGTKIGKGAFGVVYSGLVRIERTKLLEVAVKTLQDNFDDVNLISIVQEFELMKIIGRHPSIVSLYGSCFDEEHYYVVMELAKHGNLKDFLRLCQHCNDTKETYSSADESVYIIQQEDLMKFSTQVAEGMQFLASKMIIHGDLSARNILVNHKLDMKISNCGLTRNVANYYQKKTDDEVNMKWMSPESLTEQVYTVSSDVWSFGIFLWEVFTMGDTPYPTVPVSSLLQGLRRGLRNDKPAFSNEELYQIMRSTWAYDPQDRPTFSELVDKLSRCQSTVDDISNVPECVCVASNLSDNGTYQDIGTDITSNAYSYV